MNSIHKIQENVTSICNIPYKYIGEQNLQLDVFFPSKKLGEEPWHAPLKSASRVVVYYHGGGWVEGDRVSRFLEVLPYLEQGWAVVNVDYRLLGEFTLIDGITDCLDALNWVGAHAAEYNFDMDKVYLAGESAGGHLALLTGLMNRDSQQKWLSSERKVEIAGIINWYGISEVGQAVSFWNDLEYTQLITKGYESNVEEFYRTVSPVTHVSRSSPPIFSVHGDRDVNVSINQSKLLHERLDALEIQNKLVVVEGKKHGGFSASELETAYGQLWEFLNPQ